MVERQIGEVRREGDQVKRHRLAPAVCRFKDRARSVVEDVVGVE